MSSYNTSGFNNGTSDSVPRVTSQEFGKYRILSELGRGGMGVVFRAYDKPLRREVALKVMNQVKAEDRHQERFARESQLLARLQHPNVIQIFDAGIHQGFQYFTMELIQGRDFTYYFKKNIPIEEILGMFVDVLQGVEYAHSKGVIHRDLKPSNVMISKKREVKVMDFGLAKDLSGEQLSASLDVVGTPEYMSPEQACGDSKLDHRTDIYSLGVILYQILVGRPPFSGNPINVIYQIVHDDIPFPSQIYSKVPRDLEAVCWKAIQKDPAKRYQDVSAFRKDVEAYLTGEPVSVKPVSFLMNTKRWLIRNRVVVAFFVLATLPVITFFYLDNKANKALLEKQQLELEKQQIEIEGSKEAKINLCLNALESLKMLLVLMKQDLESRHYTNARLKSVQIASKLKEIEFSLAQIQGETKKKDAVQKAQEQYQFLKKVYQDFQRYGIQFGPLEHKIRSFSLSHKTGELQEDEDIDANTLSYYRFANVSQPSFEFYASQYREDKDRFTIYEFPRKKIREIILKNTLDDIAFSPNNKMVAFRDFNRNVYVESIDGKKIFQLEQNQPNENRDIYTKFFNLQFCPNSRYLFFTSGVGTTIVDISKKKVVFHKKERVNDYKMEGTRAHFNPDGTRLTIVGDHPSATMVLENGKWRFNKDLPLYIHTNEMVYYEDPRVVVGVSEKLIFIYNVDKKIHFTSEPISYIDTGIGGNIDSFYVQKNYIAILARSKLQVWNYVTRQKILESRIYPNRHNSKVFIKEDLSTLGVWTSRNIYYYSLLKRNSRTVDVHGKIKVKPFYEKSRFHRMKQRRANTRVALGDNGFMGYYWPSFFWYNNETERWRVVAQHDLRYQELKRIHHLGNNSFFIKSGSKGTVFFEPQKQRRLNLKKVENQNPYIKNVLTTQKKYFINLQYDEESESTKVILKQRVGGEWRVAKTRLMDCFSRVKGADDLDISICYIEAEDCFIVSDEARIYAVENNKEPKLILGDGEIYDEILTLKSFHPNEVCLSDRKGYFAIHNWKTEECLARVFFPQAIIRIAYHRDDDVYFLQTRDNIWVYRAGKSSKFEDSKLYYPFCYTEGLGVNSFDFSDDFRQSIFSFYDGKFVYFPTNLEE